MSLNITITNAGFMAYAAAQAAGTLPLVITKVGVSPTAITPLPTMTVLAGQTKQITTISGLTTDLKSVHLTVRDETADAYTLKSFGLYLANGTLFAIYGQPDAIIVKTAAVVVNLAIDITFATIDAAALTFGDTNFVNPDATTAIKGVVELATSAETITGTDAGRVVTPAGLWAAFTSMLTSFGVWRASNDGAGSGLDADLLDGNHAAAFVKTTDVATTIAKGAVELATSAETLTGTDATRAVTPAGFLSAFNSLLASLGIWRAGNDGAGSGLDADLLDGLQGAAYAKIADAATDTAKGVVELATSAETLTGTDATRAVTPAGFLSAFNSLLSSLGVWRAGNDGSGSGLDADLLDGQHASFFTAIAARLGYTPANKAGDTFAGAIKRDATFFLDMAGANPQIALDGSDYILYDRSNNVLKVVIDSDQQFYITGAGVVAAATALYAAGNLAWTAGNDGAGSGLDADLLDGLQGAAYVRVADVASATAKGAVELATAAETLTGTDATRAVTPSGFLSAFNSLLASLGIWRAGNDGSGSGLDADLLDGNHATAFVKTTDVASDTAKGVVELATAAETLTGADATRAVTPFSFLSAFNSLLSSLTVWRAGNDGAGSGLDADLLDGQQGSFYTAIAARLGFNPVQQGGGVGQAGNKVYIGWDGAQLKAQVDAVDLGGLVTEASYVNNFDPNKGSRVSPDGYIENWIKVMCNGDNFVDITWDRVFPNAAFCPTVTPMNTTPNRDNGGAVISYSQTGARVARSSPNPGENENNYLFVRVNGF